MENKIAVTNRSFGTVIYNIPEMGLRREFAPKETKKITPAELEALTSQPGGRELIEGYLLVHDAEALEEIVNVQVEPEYWLTEEKIPSWMQSCSDDEFIDALNFAPEGVKSLIKDYAVKLPLNDFNKINAIKDILGFDVMSALKINKMSQEDAKPATTAGRRTNPNYKENTETTSAPAAPVRRMTLGK